MRAWSSCTGVGSGNARALLSDAKKNATIQEMYTELVSHRERNRRRPPR